MEEVHIGMKLVEQLLLEILKLKMGGLHFSRKMGESILMKNENRYLYENNRKKQ